MSKLPLNPFFAWTALALKSSEMMTASAEVITHRLTRMANADVIPSLEDQKEFTLMGQEKMEAGTESLMAMGTYWMTLNHEMGAQAFKHMMDIGKDMTSLATSTSPGQVLTRQAKLADSLTKGAMHAADISGKAAALTDHGLKPVHSRAVANAKRLGKRGK
ncbi:hypothetical protein PQU92_02035 [Asticcacaulis sp. BYS171W]|uniref:Phasin domain-containing protein n=1 Tax=Asticcacaulis aquaticus TaxID=2984212 RepID=A0ABT5HPN9_9CAUL|nr:polyhydroxyalkanoate granule-associated phasin [Asticcacaulis aquaticus]MDC7682035.1 hypothetical protein [Asticcacaulis aquaticus]